MILRTRKNKNYTTLCNVALNDPDLSLKAKGLFAYLMSKPDDWKISYRGLMAQLKEGQRAILGALAELEEAGYLDRELEQDKRGHIFFTSVLHEEPVRAKRTHGQTPVAAVRTKSTHGKPTRGKRTPIVNTEELNTDKEKLNKKMGATESQSAEPPTSPQDGHTSGKRGEYSPAKEKLRKELEMRRMGKQGNSSPSSLFKLSDDDVAAGIT